MALPPVTDYRMSPPVDSIGDRRLERARRDFMDLIRSDERKHEGDSRRRERERQGNDQEAQTQDAQRQARIATDRNRARAVNQPGPADPARPALMPRNGNGLPDKASSAKASQVGANRDAASDLPRPGGDSRLPPNARVQIETHIAPVSRRDSQARQELQDRQESQELQTRRPVGNAPAARLPVPQSPLQTPAGVVQPRPPEGSAPAGSRWPEPPEGSSLVAASSSGKALNLVASGQLPQPSSVFRLNRDVPSEVAERIAEFMRSGTLNRTPFSVSQDAVVAELAGATVEDAGKGASAASEILSGKLMRSSLAQAAQGPSSQPGELARPSIADTDTLLPNKDRPALRVVNEDTRQSVGRANFPEDSSASGSTEATAPIILESFRAANAQGDLGEVTTSRGARNPFFGASQNPGSLDSGREDAAVINLIAGSRSALRRDRIA